MIREVIDLWIERKGILQKAIECTDMADVSYRELVKLIAIHIIGIDEEDLVLVEADTDDYQGCNCYLFCEKHCTCYDFYTALAYYGSCSGCDTILGITGYEAGMPDSGQVKDFMDLCLDLVQSIKQPYNPDVKEMEADV